MAPRSSAWRFSALTIGVALLEPSVAHASEQLNISKAKAVVYVGIAMVIVGFASLYSIEFLDSPLMLGK